MVVAWHVPSTNTGWALTPSLPLRRAWSGTMQEEGLKGEQGARYFKTIRNSYEIDFTVSSERCFWSVDLFSSDLVLLCLLIISFLPSTLLFCESLPLSFSCYLSWLLSFSFLPHAFFHQPFRLSTSPSFRVLFLFPTCISKRWSTGLQPRKGIPGSSELHQRAIASSPTPPTQGTKFKERIPPQLLSNLATASIIIWSHLMVKNWPETKESRADKCSRLGLGKVWGFSTYMQLLRLYFNPWSP